MNFSSSIGTRWIPVATRSKAGLRDHLLDDTVGSNPGGGMDGCQL